MLKSVFPRSVALACAVLVVLTTGACADGKRGGVIPYNNTSFKAPDAPAPVLDQANAPVTPGDTLAMTVFQVESLSQDYVVDTTGSIDIALIGPVKVAGLTTAQARALVARRLGERYLQNPNVTLTLKSSTARNVTVDGSVRQPGVYPVTQTLSLLEAVALARGTDDNANPRRVAIFRTIGGQRMAAAFDLTDIRRGQAENPPVYAGDIVVVDGRSKNTLFSTIIQALPVAALFRPY